MKLNRRNFISASAGIAATISSPMVFGASRPKVVVIGGGAGEQQQQDISPKIQKVLLM